jgi:hypothetical protein
MTCDRYRPLLALLIGNDLDPREAAAVRQHLGDCACCQTEWTALQSAIGALQTVSQQTVIPEKGSLRSQVLRRVASQPTLPEDAAPGWLTLGAFTAACAAVLWLTVSTPVFDFDFRELQVTDLDEASPTARPNIEQYPQLQLVGSAQAPVPIQVVTEGNDRQPSRVQGAPKLLGGPRSF